MRCNYWLDFDLIETEIAIECLVFVRLGVESCGETVNVLSFVSK